MKYTDKDHKDLKASLKIDRDLLDAECIDQPHLFYHASEGFAVAAAERDDEKRILELVEAEIDHEIRSRPVEEGGKKPSEVQIKSDIIRTGRYQDAYKAYLAASFDANKWKSLKAAFEDRKSMLEVAQRLFSSGYWGEVSSAERNEARARFEDKRNK